MKKQTMVFLHAFPLTSAMWKPQFEYLKTYLDNQKIENAILCGLSIGGYIALHFAQKYPQYTTPPDLNVKISSSLKNLINT